MYITVGGSVNFSSYFLALDVDEQVISCFVFFFDVLNLIFVAIECRLLIARLCQTIFQLSLGELYESSFHIFALFYIINCKNLSHLVSLCLSLSIIFIFFFFYVFNFTQTKQLNTNTFAKIHLKNSF